MSCIHLHFKYQYLRKLRAKIKDIRIGRIAMFTFRRKTISRVQTRYDIIVISHGTSIDSIMQVKHEARGNLYES
jgi:hypothetical protein